MQALVFHVSLRETFHYLPAAEGSGLQITCRREFVSDKAHLSKQSAGVVPYVKLLVRSNAVWRKLSRHYLTGFRFQNFCAYSSIERSAAK